MGEVEGEEGENKEEKIERGEDGSKERLKNEGENKTWNNSKANAGRVERHLKESKSISKIQKKNTQKSHNNLSFV